MNNICCLLDACTTINLIHIDDNDFILKKLEKLDLHINDLVFEEIKINVFARLDSQEKIKYSNREEILKRKKDIQQKLSFFRGKTNDNNILLKELGKDFFDRIRDITKYNKKSNGELCSTAYALYLSRDNNKKVFFYTDDFPAKEHFTNFFNFQQIGHIKDSVDLLILLYWLDENFSQRQLKNLLSDLYSQYASDVKLLEKKLVNYVQQNVDAKFKRSYREEAEKLNILIHQLQNFKFQGIAEIQLFFKNKRSKHKAITEIIDEHSYVFDLDNDSKSENFLNKISRTISEIETSTIFKMLDLC